MDIDNIPVSNRSVNEDQSLENSVSFVAKMDSVGTAKIFILANLVDVFYLRLVCCFAPADCGDLVLVELLVWILERGGA